MWNNMDKTGGGGFMNEPNEFSSPSTSNKAVAVQRLQSVVPVVIRQLKDCPGNEFTLFGMGTQILSIVGILREYEVQSTKATYKVEDHTGSISCIWWLESDDDNTPNLPAVKEGRYLRVYGSFRIQEGEKQLMVLRMHPVDNMNEVTTHLLEVIHVRLEAENLTKTNANKVKNNPGTELANSMSFMGENTTMDVDMGFTNLQQKVYNVLKPVKSDRGLNTDAILGHFPSNQHKEVRAALEFLINEGHAYSTIDNDHYKVTECL